MSPVLLVGPSGCGKTAIATHLATRILDEVAPSVPATQSPAIQSGGSPTSNTAARSTTSLFMPGVDFARYYARAVDSDEITRFRRDIDSAPVLVIDDVHLMVGKPASQDELASRIENRSRSGRPTILTSRRLPTQVAGLRPLLVSRMLPGLTIPIRPPGREARRELLLEFSRRRQLAIGDDELDMLCDALEVDLPARNLDSAMAHVDLYCRMKGCPPNVHAVRAAIGSIQPTSDLSTDRVAKVVSRRYKLKLSDLKSGTRRQEVVRARSLAMYLTRQLTGSSYHQIGKYFGGRDHTTVLHACRKTESMIQDDTELRVTADEVTEQLKATG
ncbi:MAG TPA: chromosomal replication initiator DnaA [Planctomycetaceae bacterium]|nr:chromosomal replication initiator DnaA [Planctomycetaceae bacterium]